MNTDLSQSSFRRLSSGHVELIANLFKNNEIASNYYMYLKVTPYSLSEWKR